MASVNVITRSNELVFTETNISSYFLWLKSVPSIKLTSDYCKACFTFTHVGLNKQLEENLIFVCIFLGHTKELVYLIWINILYFLFFYLSRQHCIVTRVLLNGSVDLRSFHSCIHGHYQFWELYYETDSSAFCLLVQSRRDSTESQIVFKENATLNFWAAYLASQSEIGSFIGGVSVFCIAKWALDKTVVMNYREFVYKFNNAQVKFKDFIRSSETLVE